MFVSYSLQLTKLSLGTERFLPSTIERLFIITVFPLSLKFCQSDYGLGFILYFLFSSYKLSKLNITHPMLLEFKRKLLKQLRTCKIQKQSYPSNSTGSLSKAGAVCTISFFSSPISRAKVSTSWKWTEPEAQTDGGKEEDNRR